MEQIRQTRWVNFTSHAPKHHHYQPPTANEASPPAKPKPKKTVNINGMFDYGKKGLSPQKHQPNVLSPRPAGVKKIYGSNKEPGFFATLVDSAKKHAEAAKTKVHTPLVADPDFLAEYRAKQTRKSMGIVGETAPRSRDHLYCIALTDLK